MFPLAIAAGIVLMLFAVGFTIAAATFVRRAVRHTPTPAVLPLPKAAVLLSLRGLDFHLVDCIRSLCRQEYAEYEVHIVIDSESDPAWSVTHDTVRSVGAKNVKIMPLRQKLPSCSLKCSALIQMTNALDSDIEAVALVDGDVIPHKTWLRELITPLATADIGATFGIPWHTPARGQLGSLIRTAWWAITAVSMALRGWVWGGTAALRTNVLRSCAIEKCWSAAMSSDTPLYHALKAAGLRTVWVPTLIVASHDECTLKAFFHQVVRYLLVRRLYLPLWSRDRVAGGALSLALILAVATLVLALSTGNTQAAVVAGFGLFVYLGGVFVLLCVVDATARQILMRNGIVPPTRNLTMLGKLLVAVPIMHFLFVVGAGLADRVRIISWRGVQYSVEGPWDVRRPAARARTRA